MQRQSVTSSNIASIGYDRSSRILEVEFLSKEIYHYFEIPENVYAGLMAASSHGSYLAANIKNHYRYQKVS